MTDDKEVVIELQNVSKTYYIREKKNNSIREKIMNFFSDNAFKEVQVLKNVSLKVEKGDFFGIIGKNGTGKSTLLKLIIGAIPPDKGGVIKTKGAIIRLALGMGFNPLLTARENIYINASILGLSFKEIGRRFDEILAFAEIEEFVDTPVRFFSSGMRSRLAFSVAVHADADIFLMDEFFGGVGDKGFKQKSKKIFQESMLKGRTIVLVTHSMGTVKKFCNKVLYIRNKDEIIVGPTRKVLAMYRRDMKEVAEEKLKPIEA